MATVTWGFQYDKIIHDTDVRSTKMFSTRKENDKKSQLSQSKILHYRDQT